MTSLPTPPLRVSPLPVHPRSAAHLPAVRLSAVRPRVTGQPSDAARLSLGGQSWWTASLSAAREQMQRLNVWQARDSGLPRSDGLTGLPNPRALNERLETLLNASDRGTLTLPGRGQQGWSLLLVDIDSFGTLNGTHGRPAGDEVLKVLTSCLRQELRTDDVLGRWNGDEFLALLPATGFEGALVAAERLRRAVSLWSFPHVGGLTVSIGVASGLPGDSLERAVARAKAAIRIAKLSGRNRVAFSE